MTSISEKIARVSDLSNYTDLTPDEIKKIFEDIGSSPEKLRAALNLWFVPDFKPNFTQLQHHALSTLQDIEFLASPDTERPQRPLRMIDLETGNIVDAWNISHLDSYCIRCILSHRWKGDEITLAHIMRAREKHMKRATEESDTSDYTIGHSMAQSDDICLVLEQCKRDILDQEQIIVTISGQASENLDVGELLRKKVEANEMKWKMTSARQTRDSKKVMVDLCKIEKKMFDKIIHRAAEFVGNDPEGLQSSEALTTSTDGVANDDPKLIKPDSSGLHTTTSLVVNRAEDAYACAERELEDLIRKQDGVGGHEEIFQRSNRLGDEVDELIRRLQWKSAVKLDNSIKEAQTIFQTNHFQGRGSRYIWSETCCIDKRNYGELSQSLSLLGDWYANAEFCLVHLDTNWREVDTVDDWYAFQRVVATGENKEENMQAPGPNIGRFREIKSTIEWATRAWTLQELVMSKMMFFMNSEWKPLSRPIESLGYIYPLVPFIALYTQGAPSNVYTESLKDSDLSKLSKWKIEDFDFIKPYLEEHEIKIMDECVRRGQWDAAYQVETERVVESLQVISVLGALGYRISLPYQYDS
ncbi:vegetative incompatibility het-e-1 [Trichoderma arundinaceum]|uniref:Vegetative incompatibility het-e-1 n=1 Tax=Trichoderma arundinaceum TaxID=490622 RepID=A0A395NU05_TRIAR|nr:vegetative incompatibility het-e-1 [Trichoderma arundinaceum]